MIRASHLSKAYAPGQPVLDNLSFEARPGEVTLMLGPNGVGKSTTLRLLAGLARPDAGEVSIAGYDIAEVAAQEHLSYLPQQIAFHPWMRCEAVLGFYAGLRGVADIPGRVGQMLRLVGLEKEARKRSGALSGGLRQRLGLAVLWLPDAPVLLLDEPGLSLDPHWRQRLKEQLQAEAAQGKTVLVATHLLGEWEGVAHRALWVHPGGNVVEMNPDHLREPVYY